MTTMRRMQLLQRALPTSGEPSGPGPSFERLWTDHVTRTRDFIKAAVARDPRAVLAAAGPLLANQVEMGAAFGKWYGKEFGDRAAFLLQEHILLFASLALAALREDREAGRAAAAALDANAQRIAVALASVNPHWPKDAVLKLLREHLAHTVAELDALVVGDRDGDKQAWDAVRRNAAEIANALAEGLRKQLAEKKEGKANPPVEPAQAPAPPNPSPIRVTRKPAAAEGK